MVGVSVTVPMAGGVIVKLCGAAELLKVSVIGVESPPPEGVRRIVPVKGPLGVTAKLAESSPTVSEVGPAKV